MTPMAASTNNIAQIVNTKTLHLDRLSAMALFS
jgi:hypothetical protein